jgi:hypothetical protein
LFDCLLFIVIQIGSIALGLSITTPYHTVTETDQTVDIETAEDDEDDTGDDDT